MSTSVDGDLCKKTDWYRAMTLTERLALNDGQSTQLPSSPFQDATTQQRFQCWKAQAPFHKENYFTQRLAADGLSEEKLKELLAMPAETLRDHTSPPSWVLTLQEAFNDEGAYDFSLPLPDNLQGRQAAVFLEQLKPLLKLFIHRLQAGLQELALRFCPLPFDQEKIVTLLFSHLTGRIFPKILKTLILELNVARIQGRLVGETPEERFRYFLSLMSRPEEMLKLFGEYPVLARRIIETLEQWVVVELEFCERLCEDWSEICQAFPQLREAGPLVEIQGNKGDLHRGGRSVSVLVWASGFHLVYKPRSLAADLHFQEVLAWLNGHGLQPQFRTLRMIDKGTYGWSEWVEAGTCSSHAEVARFFQRQGGYLALLYALEAVDIHFDNIIAVGEHPILIDLESLLQPRVDIRGQTSLNQGYPALQVMYHSVLRIGLLPQRFFSHENAIGIDMSGLGMRKDQMAPLPLPKWDGIGTDQMSLTQDFEELDAGDHRATLNGEDVDIAEFCDDVVQGFNAVYRLLMHHRDELLQQILPRFAHDEIRCVLRQTHAYGMLLADCCHPDILRDGLELERLFDRLWMCIESLPCLEPAIKSERADLLAGDIPAFTTTPSSRDLYTSSGECIPAFFLAPALEVARQHLIDLNEEDLEKQIWVIRASFTSLTLGTAKTGQSSLVLQPVQKPVEVEHLLSAARAVGDRLELLSLSHDDEIGWLGITLLFDREWCLLPAGIDLYNGVSGMIFYLAYLGHVSGEERYTRLAMRTQATLHCQVKDLRDRSDLGMIGIFTGIGSYIYLLSHLGTLWGDPTLYQEAKEIAELLPDHIEQDRVFDVMGGAAGCIAALLSLYAVAPSEVVLSMAVRCGDHLIAHARQMKQGLGWSMRDDTMPLLGFSHGSAGIAWSLLRLYEVSGEERFRQTALAALDYERSLFSPDEQNWPDLRGINQAEFESGSGKQPAFMTAWCHGASGITLGRLGSLPLIDDATTREEIEIGLHTTMATGFHSNHSLCHGMLGNLEVLLMAEEVLKRPHYQEERMRLLAMIFESVEKQGRVTGIPKGVETPGLLFGLGGIGYGFLRQAFPTQVPSILVPAPPRIV